MSSIYNRHQSYAVDQAARTLAETIQDNQMYLMTVDSKISALASEITCNAGLIEGEDFMRLTSVMGNSDLSFNCVLDNVPKSITIAEMINKFEEYDKRIAELEERLAQYEFYNENAA